VPESLPGKSVLHVRPFGENEFLQEPCGVPPGSCFFVLDIARKYKIPSKESGKSEKKHFMDCRSGLFLL